MAGALGIGEGREEVGKGGVLDIMHGRSRMAIVASGLCFWSMEPLAFASRLFRGGRGGG